MAKARAAKEAPPAPPEEPGGISRFQSFTMETIQRGLLKNAPYNPRYITDASKVKLRKALNDVGLVQPLVWNKRTGNLVGGHQRIAALDALEGTRNYALTVAVVDVDDLRERELNVLLNNSEVSGEFDAVKLKELLDTEGLTLDNTGFNIADMMQMFGEAPHQQKKEGGDEMEKHLAALKGSMESLEQMAKGREEDGFYVVAVFPNTASCEELHKELGLVLTGLQTDRYIHGPLLVQFLRDLKKAQAAPARDGG